MEENDVGEHSSIVSIFWKDNEKKLGVAWYDEITNEVRVEAVGCSLEDIDDTFENIKSITNPTLFLLHPRFIANQQILDLLVMRDEAYDDGDGDGDARITSPYKYVAVKSSAWNSDTALDLACSKLIVKEFQRRVVDQAIVRTSSESHSRNGQTQLSRQMPHSVRTNYLNLTSLIEDSHLRSALGALLTHMQSNVFSLDEGYINISNIRAFPQSKYLRIDSQSFR